MIDFEPRFLFATDKKAVSDEGQDRKVETGDGVQHTTTKKGGMTTITTEAPGIKISLKLPDDKATNNS